MCGGGDTRYQGISILKISRYEYTINNLDTYATRSGTIFSSTIYYTVNATESFGHSLTILFRCLFFIFSEVQFPRFAEPIPNVTVTIGRDALLACVVDNLRNYKVSTYIRPRKRNGIRLIFEILKGKKICKV